MADWVDLVVELGGTLIGAGVGLGLAMWYDRRKKKEELDETRRHIIASLKEEVATMLKELQQPNLGAEWISATNQYKYQVAILSRAAFDSAVNSGNFSLLTPKLQTQISTAYSRIDYCNSLVDQISRFYFSSLYTQDAKRAEDVIREMSNDLNKQYSALSDDIRELLPMLESVEATK